MRDIWSGMGTRHIHKHTSLGILLLEIIFRFLCRINMFEWKIGLESLSADLWGKGTCGACQKNGPNESLVPLVFLMQIFSRWSTKAKVKP